MSKKDSVKKNNPKIYNQFKNSLQLAPESQDGEIGEKVISFYDQLDGTDPLWTISLIGTAEDKKLSVKSEKGDEVLLTMTPEGRIGINNTQPKYDIDVNGIVGMKSRIGTYKQGTIKANNEWQPILKGLKSCNMFEVIAMAYGKEGEGKYASLHAIASNAYSGKNGRIHCSRDYYSWKWWRRIGLRWVGSPFNYDLEMKTFSDYGISGEIEYSITRLGKDIAYNADMVAEFKDE